MGTSNLRKKREAKVNSQNVTATFHSSAESCEFVVRRPSRPLRFSHDIVCHLLVFAEAATVGIVAATLLSSALFCDGDVPYGVSGGVAVGSIVLFINFLSGSASYDRFASRLTIMAAALFGALLTMSLAALDGAQPQLALLAGAIILATVPAVKTLTKLLLAWIQERGHLIRLVAVAADDPAQRSALVRLLGRREDIELVFAGSPAQLDTLDGLVRAGQLDEVVLSGHQANEEDILALTGLAVTLVRVAPQDKLELAAFDPVWGKKQVFGPWGAPASVIAVPPLQGWRGITKRAMDISGALLAVIILSPVMIASAVAVKLDSPGPVLFVQERAGYRNKPFRMFKFRSMAAAKADPTGAQLTLRNDPRVTKVGAFLRRTSLDELPQLFNVLKGEMSLVGPRPHPKGAKAGKAFYDDLIPNFYARYRMKPGITGLAQVNGLRGNTETEQHLIDRFGRDLQYAAQWTPILDLAILLRTVSHLVKSTNAY